MKLLTTAWWRQRATSFFEIKEIAVPTDPDSNIVRVFLDSATGELSVRKDDSTTVSLEGGGFTDDIMTNAFKSSLLHILGGDKGRVWLPAATGATLNSFAKDQDIGTFRQAGVSTAVESFDTAPAQLGSGDGQSVTFNGTSEHFNVPDNAELSFGDGANDEEMTVFALINLTDATSSVVLCKFDTTASEEEWILETDASDKIALRMYDDSAAAYIGGKYDTALSQSTWMLVVFTYDGTTVREGIAGYIFDGTLKGNVTLANDSSGTYTAMENGAELVEFGVRKAAGTRENFFDGKAALWGVTNRAISEDDAYTLATECSSFFGLTLV